MRSELEQKEAAEFKEFSAESEYRNRLKEEAQQRAGNEVFMF